MHSEDNLTRLHSEGNLTHSTPGRAHARCDRPDHMYNELVVVQACVVLNFETRQVEWYCSLGHVDLQLLGALLRVPDDLYMHSAQDPELCGEGGPIPLRFQVSGPRHLPVSLYRHALLMLMQRSMSNGDVSPPCGACRVDGMWQRASRLVQHWPKLSTT